MTWFLVPVAVIVLLAVPYFAADSRDGADWKPVALRGTGAGHSSHPAFFQVSRGIVCPNGSLESSCLASLHETTKNKRLHEPGPGSAALTDGMAER